MKKLLSILAATTMVVSAPLSVVACGDGTGDVLDPNWDFNTANNALMGILSSIYQENLAEDFSDYFFTNDEDIQSKKLFDNISLELLKKELDGKDSKIVDVKSDNFKKMASDLEKLPNKDKLTKDTNNKVVKNVNYKQLLVNGNQNPFETSEIKVASIQLYKLDEDVCSMQFRTESTYQTVDASGDVAYNNVKYNGSITIFSEKATADRMNAMAKDVERRVQTPTWANSFSIKSDSGDLLEASKLIDQSTEIKNNFEKLGKETIDSNTDWKDYTFDNKKMKAESNLDRFIAPIPGRTWGDTTGMWNEWGANPSDAGIENKFNQIMRNGSKSEIDEFIKFYMAQKEEDLTSLFGKDIAIRPEMSTVPSTLKYIESGFNRFINPFSNTGGSINDVREIAWEIRIDESTDYASNTDKYLLGVHEANVSGLSISYESKITSGKTVSIELPTQKIAVKQNVTRDLKEVLEDYFRAQIALMRKINGFSDNNSSVTKRIISLPRSIRDDIKTNAYYDAQEVFQAIYDDARESIVKDNPEYNKHLHGFYFGPGKYVHVKSDWSFSLAAGDKSEYDIKYINPRSYFYSKGEEPFTSNQWGSIRLAFNFGAIKNGSWSFRN
ncbi:hypothetical protein SSABA_v1c08990 [Spiroplasma sabaudiense Ar-1343]|uniref:Lipoprotein n=1 Tax=Spiroplasma sabaudiense Ar-1343 TaxID=1276257 RepID=W6AAV7_9MOLU|nr:lipoprotein [Spiroplasma sabaudiense]AHI54298.1 hypothetical protein SSABA_v1c08990 [Spiroplasma sabaudiense Ar-1343]